MTTNLVDTVRHEVMKVDLTPLMTEIQALRGKAGILWIFLGLTTSYGGSEFVGQQKLGQGLCDACEEDSFALLVGRIFLTNASV